MVDFKKLRIPIKFKVFGLVSVLVFFALSMILYQTAKIFNSDKEDFVKELSAKLASSASKNIADKIATVQDKLVVFISSKESLARTGARINDQTQVLFARYQEFSSISLSSPSDGDELKVDWVLRNPKAEAIKWLPDFEKDFIKSLNVRAAKQYRRWIWNTTTTDGQKVTVLGFAVDVVDAKNQKKKKKVAEDEELTTKTVWVFGFFPFEFVQQMLTDFSTGISSALLVDADGVVLAASDKEQVGKNLSAHSVVSEVMKNNRPAATGDYKDINGKLIVGSFEIIPKINLGVVVTTPKDKAFEAARTLQRNILFIGFVILMAAMGTAIVLSNFITNPLKRLTEISSKIGAGDFNVPVDVETNDEIGDLAKSFSVMEQGLVERDTAIEQSKQALVQSEKMSAFGQLSAGIAHEVKNPLAGILGHAQLAMSKIQNDDIKKHLEVIEKETRRCKAIVENLMKFARAEKVQLEPTNLAQVVQDTINLVEHQLTLAGCKIFKDFQPCPMVPANANQLQQVLLNLMVNASHAMENCAKKNVIVRVLQTGSKAQIQIEDTGAGIPPDIQKKIFEPFFTTKPAGKGTGLGLSVSIGIVKDHKGEIYLKSEMNEGTTFFIDIPIPEGAKMPDKPLEHTHGGKYLTADEKVLKDAKVHEKQISKGQEQKPTELSAAVTAKDIDKALNDFDARKVAATKPKQDLPKVEVTASTSAATKVPELKLSAKKAKDFLNKKVEETKTIIEKTKKPAEAVMTLPKVELKATPKPAQKEVVEQPTKVEIKKPKLKLPKNILATQTPGAKTEAAKQMKEEKEIDKTQTLKAETKPEKKLEAVKVQAGEIKKTTEIPRVVIPKPSINKASEEKSGDGGFKVQINRPKIKA
ncbi:MAG: HAMP domain-containing protein [Oligoflexia bacterium]|nr:HAMP domain-containing protein [Oligoflexia bacterium]